MHAYSVVDNYAHSRAKLSVDKLCSSLNERDTAPLHEAVLVAEIYLCHALRVGKDRMTISMKKELVEEERREVKSPPPLV